MKYNSAVVLYMNARLQAEQRIGVYEQPLNELVQNLKLGKVSGGKTELSESGEPLRCEIEILCPKGREKELCMHLKDVVVPKNSFFAFGEEGETVPVGNLEGLAVYIDGVVFSGGNAPLFVDDFCLALEKEISVASYFEGARECALYFYGQSFESLKKRAEEFLLARAVLKSCRFERIA